MFVISVPFEWDITLQKNSQVTQRDKKTDQQYIVHIRKFYEEILITKTNTMDKVGILTHAFKLSTQKAQVDIFVSELNASQVYGTRIGGSTH